MKIYKTSKLALAVALLSGICLSALASQTPQYDTFGPLAVSFGGSGIPNGAVAQSTFGQTGVLGLTATQRFSNPLVTNNGSGRFFAQSGIDQTDANSVGQQYARWNFNFHINSGGQTGYEYQLFMDVDPTAGEDFKSFGASGASGPGWVSGVNQNSLNIGMSFIEALGYTFDPTVDGEYTFALQASDDSGVIAKTSIVVQVGNGAPIPEPGTLALAGLALAGLAVARRKQTK